MKVFICPANGAGWVNVSINNFMPKINRALVSVTDKTGIVDFCRELVSLGVEILSTGGTAKILRGENIPVCDVSEYTGFPEALDGRLKTLHPKIEGGILGIRDNPTHQKEMLQFGIKPIDLVVVNLYNFEKTAFKEEALLKDMIEQIDIGGSTMLRAGAKSYQDVTVVMNPGDYQAVISEMKSNGGSVDPQTNFKLAVKVFEATARYDSMIASRLSFVLAPPQPFPATLYLRFEKIQNLRYGENPHQLAAYYREHSPPEGSITEAVQLHGKELSYNNILDCDSALQCVAEFKDPACVIIKHTNPCGAALGTDLYQAYLKAHQGDPVSSFGGIIAVNRKVDKITAKAVGQTFFECLVAPDYDDEALTELKNKKNIRLLKVKEIPAMKSHDFQYRRVSGGLLVQENDAEKTDLALCPVPTKRKPTKDELEELDFAWKLVKHVKSNAIVFTKNRQLIGLGAGQMSRVDSVKLAVIKSKIGLEGAVMASDAFFPFRDGLDEAAKVGIKAVVQPGGSVKDSEVIASADEHGIAMIFTGMRHFRH